MASEWEWSTKIIAIEKMSMLPNIKRGLQFLLLATITSCLSYAANPCSLRSYNNDGLVCVCNSTYCDTLDPIKIPSGHYVLYSTTKAGLRFQKSLGVLNTTSLFDIKFKIRPSLKHQSMIGFGGAFTDAAGLNILSLSSPAQDHLLRSYFSPNGIELTIGRVPIAGCDFSTYAYTYDDVVNDTDLSEFNLTKEDFTYKIPLIKRAMEMSEKPIRLLGAAWTAPPWMKTNNAFTGFGFLRDEYFELWANYHIKFLDAYKEEGLEFWGISTGNEPSNGILPVMKFNSMGWTPQKQRQWVAENLGPSLENSQHKYTKLLLLDDQRFMFPWWINIVMEDPNAAKYISGMAVHWYWDNILPPVLLTATHNNFPDKFILGTEASKGDRPWDHPKVKLGSWRRAEDYMADIIQDTNHWVSGWVDWNLALDLVGGPNWASNFVDAAIIVNKTADEFYKQPMFYALGHFSKFVPEDSVHITVEPRFQNGIFTTAFQTPSGQIVIVFYNQRNSNKNITFEDESKGTISITVPKRSFHTLMYALQD